LSGELASVDRPPVSGGTAAAPLAGRARFVPWILAVGALDLGLEQFMVVPIVPAVQQAEQVPLTTAAWLVTGFLLAAVIGTPLLGRLGDMYGRRRILLVSLIAFAGGSLVCALAGSIEWLIAGRVLQGLGAAFGPLAIGLARDHAPRERAPALIGVLIAAAGAGAAVGLVLGGALVDLVSVAAVFWFLFGVACLLLVAVVVFVPETPVRDRAQPDWAGAALLATALGTALLAISQGNAWGWSSGRVVGLFAASAAAIVLFAAVERSTSAPIVDVRQLAARSTGSATLVAFALGFALFIAGVVVPQVATLPEASGYGLGLTITQTGLILMPGALAIVAGGWASGRLATRVGARALVGVGVACSACAYAGLAVAHHSIPAIVLANVALGLGIGLAFAAITNLVVYSVDERRTSVFVATAAVSRSTGSALGVQVAAAIVIAAGVTEAGFPAEDGFTGAFVLGLVASLAALVGVSLIPGRSTDPLTESV
jgi:MFS family permease